MSKGSYAGGHTVIGPRSGWFSFAEPTRDQDGISDQLRLHHVDAVIWATLQGKPVPPPPKQARAILDAEIKKAGNPVAWAKAQPDYQQRLDKRTKRFKKTGGVAEPALIAMLRSVPKRKQANVKSDQGSDLYRQALLKERDKFVKAMNAAQEIIRDCRTGITRVDRQLRQLK